METELVGSGFVSVERCGLPSTRAVPGYGTMVAAFAIPFVVYVFTLAPTIYNLDSAELSTAAYTGGIMRATGYPLYLMIGYVWSRLPIGDVGCRMNLFSAFCGAMTVALTERVLVRLRIGPWARLGALGLLAFGTHFWALSLIAEVYTLHTLLMSALILALLRLGDSVTTRRMALVGLVGGLSLSHHGAAVLLIPGALWALGHSFRRESGIWRCALALVAGGLVGLTPYLWLPLRYTARPAFNYAGHFDAAGVFTPLDLTLLWNLMWLVSGRSFAGGMLAYRGQALLEQIKAFALLLWQTFLAVGIGPGLLGLAMTWLRSRWVGGMLTLMFALSAGFYIDYQVADKVTMFLPAYLVWAIWVGVGVQALIDWLAEERDRVARASVWVIRALMAGFACFALAWNWRLVDLSDDWSARERAEAVLASVEPDALVIGWWDTIPVVEYLQLVEGRRPDVQSINRFLISSQDLAELIASAIGQRPVYIDAFPSTLSGTIQAVPVSGVDKLHRLYPK